MHNLKIARARAGLTLAQLAEKADVGVNTISDIEAGHRDPQAVTLHKIARALEVDPATLVSHEKIPA
jgi:transcriptional regulator with XRE-family HTH domain